jgi:polyisoprenoid-binding protein YceI
MKKTFLFLGVIALAFTLSACTNGAQNTVNESANFPTSENTSEENTSEELDIESGDYSVDADASDVTWLGERIVGNSHTGDIEVKSGNLIIEENKIISGEFIIDMNTISDSDGSERLETHLKSEDFFAVDEYPESELVINDSSIISSNGNDEVVLEVEADLTIKGITNPINFTATVIDQDYSIVASSEFSIDRSKWDIKYDSGSFFQDLGDRAIKDEIYFDISILANKE